METQQIKKPRLRIMYEETIVPTLKKEFGYSSVMAVPRLEKIVLNMGVGDASVNPKVMDSAVNELSLIAGQRAIVRRARKSIAAFKLREGMMIGCSVCLRGSRMYEFIDRLFNVVLPRVRDFRGLSRKSFDLRGNYTLALLDQIVFPEIDYSKVEHARGLSITIVTTAKTDAEARSLLTAFGMPFVRERTAAAAAPA